MMIHHHQQTINIPNTSNGSFPYTSRSGNRENYFNLCGTLHEASITGDWETARLIFDKHPDLVGCDLSNLGTSLHVVATAKETKWTLNFVKNLVRMMTMIELELTNKHGNTAFWIACASGKKKMAEIMMEKNPKLMDIHGKDKYLSLSIGAKRGSYDIVKWLYNNYKTMSGAHLTDKDMDDTLLGCLENDMFDLALEILKDGLEPDRHVSVYEVLAVLARRPEAFRRYKRNSISRIIVERELVAEKDTDALKILKIIWGHAVTTMNLNEFEDMMRGPPTPLTNGTIQHCSRILFVAAERGNTGFIIELLRTYPDLMLVKNDDGLTIFHVAVMHRHQEIYNLLHEIGDSSDDVYMLTDKSGNNMLHLVGKTSNEMTSKMSRASLLMQHELMWFKEVEHMMPFYLREAKNKDGQTPYDLFTKESNHLISKGMELMKDCMVVVTLIITIAFGVAFTIPGGYSLEHGLPVFIHQRAFIVFVIADVISLVASSTALIVYISVLASSENQRGLMHSLPRKLMICLLLIVISIAAMMVTFSASFFVLYHNKLRWLPFFIAAFATTPIIQFVLLQYPIFVDMLRCVYESHYVFQPKKRMLYTTKPRLPLD